MALNLETDTNSTVSCRDPFPELFINNWDNNYGSIDNDNDLVNTSNTGNIDDRRNTNCIDDKTDFQINRSEAMPQRDRMRSISSGYISGGEIDKSSNDDISKNSADINDHHYTQGFICNNCSCHTENNRNDIKITNNSKNNGIMFSNTSIKCNNDINNIPKSNNSDFNNNNNNNNVNLNNIIANNDNNNNNHSNNTNSSNRKNSNFTDSSNQNHLFQQFQSSNEDGLANDSAVPLISRGRETQHNIPASNIYQTHPSKVNLTQQSCQSDDKNISNIRKTTNPFSQDFNKQVTFHISNHEINNSFASDTEITIYETTFNDFSHRQLPQQNNNWLDKSTDINYGTCSISTEYDTSLPTERLAWSCSPELPNSPPPLPPTDLTNTFSNKSPLRLPHQSQEIAHQDNFSVISLTLSDIVTRSGNSKHTTQQRKVDANDKERKTEVVYGKVLQQVVRTDQWYYQPLTLKYKMISIVTFLLCIFNLTVSIYILTISGWQRNHKIILEESSIPYQQLPSITGDACFFNASNSGQRNISATNTHGDAWTAKTFSSSQKLLEQQMSLTGQSSVEISDPVGSYSKVQVKVHPFGNAQVQGHLDSGLKIPKTGVYFVFYGVHLVYEHSTRCAFLMDEHSSTHMIHTDIYGRHQGILRSEHTCCQDCLTEQTTDFAGGVFYLNEGTSLQLDVSDPSLVQTGKNTYIGFFLIDSRTKSDQET